MNEDLKVLFRSILTRLEALERGWWTADGIERLLADPSRHAFRLYSLLILELTIRIHVEHRPSATPPNGDLADFALAG